MTEIILDVSQITTWYYLLIAGIVLLCLWATLKHKSFFPLVWGLVLSGSILAFQNQFAPLLFGVLNYEWGINPVMFVLTGVFAVMWFGYIGLTMYNCVTRGSVIE